jgi:hypothetical protein
MKRSFVVALFYLALLTPFTSRSQSWQWGVRGGSIDNAIGKGPNENVVDICTDKWNNVYVLAIVYKNYIDIDGHSKTAQDYANICIASFKCDGSYRWSKVIGDNNDDLPTAIGVDTLGGVYVTGTVAPIHGSGGSCLVDLDTNIGETNKAFFILKYDTGGTYKWFVMPEADTVTPSFNSGPIDMSVDASGNTYTLCLLNPGAFANGAEVITNEGLYILKYNEAGQFQSVTTTPVTFSKPPALLGMLMKMDWKNNRYYLAGSYDGTYGSLTMGSTSITNTEYIAAISGSGSVLWVKQNSSPGYGGITQRPTIDALGSIYITGSTTHGDTFNGYTFTNSLSSLGYSFPYAVKLDTDGTNSWVVNGASQADLGSSGIAIIKDTVAIFGIYGKTMKMGTITVSSNMYGYNLFMARILASTGDVLEIDTLLSGNNNNEYSEPLTVDGIGNFYGGGSFDQDLHVNGDTLNKVGGETDWFVAKFGTTNCQVPNAVHNILANNNEVQVYPNPITGSLFVKNASAGTSYNIYNVLGQQLLSGTINNNTEIINTEDLKLGTYLLQLTDKNGYRTNRTIVKQ